MIDIEFLKKTYGKEKTLNSIESMILYLYSCGVEPNEIKLSLIAEILGLTRRRTEYLLAKEGKNLTELKVKHIPAYKPKRSFREVVNALLKLRAPSRADLIYEEIKGNPRITPHELRRKLELSYSTVGYARSFLSKAGLVVSTRYYYFPTRCSIHLTPADLRVMKQIRSEKLLACLLLLHEFKKLSTVELSKAVKTAPTTISTTLKRVTQKGRLKVSKGCPRWYELAEDMRLAFSHLISYWKEIDEKGLEEFMRPMRYRVIKHKFAGKRVKVKEDLLQGIKQRLINRKKLATDLQICVSTLYHYLSGRTSSMPFEVFEGIVRACGYKWRDVWDKIEAVKLRRGALTLKRRLEEKERILRKYIPSVLEKIKGVHLLGVRLKAIEKEVKNLSVYRILKEGKRLYTEEIVERVKARKPDVHALQILAEIKACKELGLIKEEKPGLYLLMK